MGRSIDREKVIKGLNSCAKWMGENDDDACGNCPYHHSHFSYYDNDCYAALYNDAIALLKEQESEAKWIYGEDKTGVDFIRFYGHCPGCGRKMTSYTGKPTQSRR